MSVWLVAGAMGGAACGEDSPSSDVPVQAVLVGAGDIADCDSDGDEATAALLDEISGTVFTVGDNAYPDGSAADYAECYEASWGRHKARTRPTPGNHEYRSAEAGPYFDYFGSAAGERGRGYYSYDLGSWHVIVLNSNVDMDAGSPQELWLRADLAATAQDCIAAYWHHPRFSSSSEHGSSNRPRAVWEALYEHGADFVIGGHDHVYERFAPQDPAGAADATGGIRQFVVGTGGALHYDFGAPEPNSEVRATGTGGVLKIGLLPDGYAWEFVPVAGASFRDAGTGSCH